MNVSDTFNMSKTLNIKKIPLNRQATEGYFLMFDKKLLAQHHYSCVAVVGGE